MFHTINLLCLLLFESLTNFALYNVELQKQRRIESEENISCVRVSTAECRNLYDSHHYQKLYLRKQKLGVF